MTRNLTDKNNNSGFYYKENIETEYIGAEETEYVDIKTGKIPKNTILNQRYKIVETIGKGGMGAVYKALDIRLRSIPVAIKEMSLETIEDERIEKVIQNFENEAGTLIRLRHNSIPRVMDFFSLNNNKCYIVMDLIEGETLDQVIRRRGKILEYEVRDWINQIADVLKYLHTRDPKIIFRDLKPSNVMITKDNEIKLIDFGIARTFKDDKSEDTTYYVSQGFSPPEQYGTGQSDERSDIYSLGALTYSLLIGRKPKIKDFKFEDLRDFVDVSDELNNAIMTATDFRPENRPQTIEDFMNLVNSDLRVKNSKRKSRKFTIVVGSILIIVVLIAATLNKNINKATKDNISHENKTTNDNISIVDTSSENISNEDENNPEIIGNTKEQLDRDIFVGTESKYNVETFLKYMFIDYEKAVKEGDPSLMYPYVTSDGESHKDYEKNIPKYHKKRVTVKFIDYKINEMKVDSNGDYIISCTTNFEIINKKRTNTQKEKADYVVKRSGNAEYLLDRIENWSVVK